MVSLIVGLLLMLQQEPLQVVLAVDVFFVHARLVGFRA